MDIEPKYLVMVEANGNNHNKYYKMIPDSNGFTVEYGRVGAACQKRSYPLSQFEKKYNEKVKKGYVDRTDLIQDLISVQKPKGETEYKEIENKAIAEIVERLISMAKDKVKKNYKVGSNQVTQAMIDEAQNQIDKLIKCDNLKDFNDTLLSLFTVIPRKMSNVNDHLARDKNSFSRIIKEEQDLLDVMHGQVVTNVVTETATEENETHSEKTILETMGLVFEQVNEREESMIKSKLGECKDRYYQAWRVRNNATQKRFDTFTNKENIKDIKLFWHGSRNENWWSIINNGLMIRPSNAVYTGSMFGDAIYAAPKARKSLNYSSLSGSYWTKGNSQFGFMALMAFAYGKPYDVYEHTYNLCSFNYKKLQDACSGANCLHAHAGKSLRNDEVVFYNADQCTIQYLVEVR